MAELIDYRVDRGLAWITIQRPEKLNALDADGWDGLTAVLERAAADPDCRTIALTGSDRAFCAGDDIAVFGQLTDEQAATDFFVGKLMRTMRAVVVNPRPVIAAVNGLAYGGGMELVTVCDLAVSAREATFCLPEGRIGAWPTVFTGAAPGTMDLKRAKEFALRMRPIDAETAHAWGLVNVVVESDRLVDEVRTVADDLLRASPQALRLTKEHLNAELATTGLERIERAVRALVTQTLFTTDLREGTTAFLEKRDPVFVGESGEGPA